MTSQYSGLEVGQFAYANWASDPAGYENTCQCIPFNPFSFAMQYDDIVWAILLNNIEDGHLQALRPRRIYAKDTAIVLETIEGLAGYPQEVMMGAKTIDGVTVCQTIVRQDIVKTTVGHDGEIVAEYWNYIDIRNGDSYSGVVAFEFTVPVEYIEWSDGSIEQIIPASEGYTKIISYTVSVAGWDRQGPTPTGQPEYDFPPIQCQSFKASMKSAGRF